MIELDRYAVLGHPVAHSRSPRIHALFAAQTGQHLSYERVLCQLSGEQGFEPTVRAFANSGARGCNVTVPFKFDALKLAAHSTARATLAGAANVLRFDAAEGRAAWHADNTDGIGLLRDLQHSTGQNLAGQRVLLVGAGGAAAGVLGPMLAARPAAVVVANRSMANALALVGRHAAWAQQHGCTLQACSLQTGADNPALQAPYGLVINASASSLAGAASPVPASVLAPGALAVDLMYGPAAQPWLNWATQNGARARDGLGMLVEQAAEAFAFWRGVRPETQAVLAILRAELEAGAAS